MGQSAVWKIGQLLLVYPDEPISPKCSRLQDPKDAVEDTDGR